MSDARIVLEPDGAQRRTEDSPRCGSFCYMRGAANAENGRSLGDDTSPSVFRRWCVMSQSQMTEVPANDGIFLVVDTSAYIFSRPKPMTYKKPMLR